MQTEIRCDLNGKEQSRSKWEMQKLYEYKSDAVRYLNEFIKTLS